MPQQQQQHLATSGSHPALVESGAAAGGDGGILQTTVHNCFSSTSSSNAPHTKQHPTTFYCPNYPTTSHGFPGGDQINLRPKRTVFSPRSASPFTGGSSHSHAKHLINSTNSSGNDTTKKLNRLSTSSSLSIITPPTTPKRPAGGNGGSSGSTGRLKMALSISLAQNFNQKLANLNDKWNDFSFLLLKSGGTSGSAVGSSGTGGANAGANSGLPCSMRSNTRNDSYHSIESAVTCTAADFEAGNFYQPESETEHSQELRSDSVIGIAGGKKQSRHGQQPGRAGANKAHDRHHRERHRLISSRRNSASGDPKEFDMLVLKTMDTGEDDNDSF